MSLQMKINHSITFLNKYYDISKELQKEAEDVLEDIDDEPVSNPHYGRDLKKKTNDFVDDVAEVKLKKIEKDRELFFKDIKEIISNKADENVIYSSQSFYDLYEDYKFFYNKKFAPFFERYVTYIKKEFNDKNTVKVFCMHKVLSSIQVIYRDFKHIVESLKKLTGKKDDE